MELVNGYYCRDCAEVELAKKGIDPAEAKRATNGETPGAAHDGNGRREPSLGVNRVNASGDVGTRLDLFA